MHPDIGYLTRSRERRGRKVQQRMGHAVRVTDLVRVLAGHCSHRPAALAGLRCLVAVADAE
jgi:hypothetical protein